MINFNQKEKIMNKKSYIQENGNTPKGGAIAFVIDILGKEIDDLKEQETNSFDVKFINQLIKINNGFVEKYNKSYGDASGGYKEPYKK